MKKTDFVSIVIPTLNRAELTARAFQSALGQTYDFFEVLVVDNGSEKECLKHMATMGMPLLHCATPGAGAARKMGVKSSRGDLMLFLDSDDILMPDALESLSRSLSSDADGVFGSIQNKNTTNQKVLHGNSTLRAPLASNTLIRRESFDKFGEFVDDNYSWPRWLMQAQANDIQLHSISDVVTTRLIHGENLSMLENTMDFYFKEIRKRIRK